MLPAIKPLIDQCQNPLFFFGKFVPLMTVAEKVTTSTVPPVVARMIETHIG